MDVKEVFSRELNAVSADEMHDRFMRDFEKDSQDFDREFARTSKIIDRGFKATIILAIVMAVVILLGSAIAAYVVMHFVNKAW